MAKLYLRLENEDGSFREYRKDKVKARWVKEGMRHSKKIQELNKKGDEIGMIEERLKFTCELFGDKDLTPDKILDGLESNELFPILDGLFNVVMGNLETTEGEVGKP